MPRSTRTHPEFYGLSHITFCWIPEPEPDLSVDKTPDSQTIDAGDDVVFTIAVTNNGPGTAKAVTLIDTLPGPVAGDWVEDPDNTECTITGGNQLYCDFGDMASATARRSPSRPRPTSTTAPSTTTPPPPVPPTRMMPRTTARSRARSRSSSSTRPLTRRRSTPARTWSSRSRSTTPARVPRSR